jgi:hypothetical protein
VKVINGGEHEMSPTEKKLSPAELKVVEAAEMVETESATATSKPTEEATLTPKTANEEFLESLRLNPAFEDTTGSKLLQVNVEKPDSQNYFRVHPTLRQEVSIVQLKDEDEIFLVGTEMQINPVLRSQVIKATLMLVMTRTGNLFLWPVKIGKADTSPPKWYRSARLAAETAMKKWVRIEPNRQGSCYNIFEATGNIPEPEWPTDVTMVELIKRAFREDQIIKQADHPVILRLLGR